MRQRTSLKNSRNNDGNALPCDRYRLLLDARRKVFVSLRNSGPSNRRTDY
ncbi:hypothetical protein WN51_10835 [Melipona quadrifasciata]|uniref:Uncharacterized protein n=1 Tax=Melipona quadrifasciata TaxID=166423 RepID=A0A0M9A750_9HYME|nr:hypothetical protein WN51_10835 [Melipona quadrifasciata]